jgi:hypothetical protein
MQKASSVATGTYIILHPGAELHDDSGHVPQHVGRDGHGHEHVYRAEDELAHVVGVKVAVPSGGQSDEGPVDGRAVLVKDAAQKAKNRTRELASVS